MEMLTEVQSFHDIFIYTKEIHPLNRKQGIVPTQN